MDKNNQSRPNSLGECPSCKLKFFGQSLSCSKCGEQLRFIAPPNIVPTNVVPTLNEKETESTQNIFDSDIERSLLDLRQTDVLVTTFASHFFKTEIKAGKSVIEALKDLWDTKNDDCRKILKECLVKAHRAEINSNVWQQILKAECNRQFYIYTRLPYVFENLKRDVEKNIEHLYLLSGNTGQEKLESLRILYFQNYSKFVERLKFIVESSHFVDPEYLKRSDYDGTPKGENDVHRWTKLNKYGGR
jgi:hypothetical protein